MNKKCKYIFLLIPIKSVFHLTSSEKIFLPEFILTYYLPTQKQDFPNFLQISHQYSFYIPASLSFCSVCGPAELPAAVGHTVV